MRRYRGYKLLYYGKDRQARIIAKMTMCDYSGYPLTVFERYMYHVQTHHRFLGIGYWRDIIVTTKFQEAKRTYYKINTKEQ